MDKIALMGHSVEAKQIGHAAHADAFGLFIR